MAVFASVVTHDPAGGDVCGPAASFTVSSDLWSPLLPGQGGINTQGYDSSPNFCSVEQINKECNMSRKEPQDLCSGSL